MSYLLCIQRDIIRRGREGLLLRRGEGGGLVGRGHEGLVRGRGMKQCEDLVLGEET